MAQSDPTDHALAAIASILDQPEGRREPEKAAVRLVHGDYYVDETIGENSSPLVTGPLDRDAAIQLVDYRESEARRRFEQLKSEMTGRSVDANSLSKATRGA